MSRRDSGADIEPSRGTPTRHETREPGAVPPGSGFFVLEGWDNEQEKSELGEAA
jgi:hypothetical protein